MIDCDYMLKRAGKKMGGVNLKVPLGHGSGADVPTGQ